MAKQRLTRAIALVGDIHVDTGGLVQKQVTGSIARTNTSAKTLGTIPSNAVITGVTTYSATASNAGTTATISVGFSGGTGTEILNGYDVKTSSSGAGQNNPNGAVFPTVSAAQTITGIYAETGTASSAGGPWLVTIEFYTV